MQCMVANPTPCNFTQQYPLIPTPATTADTQKQVCALGSPASGRMPTEQAKVRHAGTANAQFVFSFGFRFRLGAPDGGNNSRAGGVAAQQALLQRQAQRMPTSGFESRAIFWFRRTGWRRRQPRRRRCRRVGPPLTPGGAPSRCSPGWTRTPRRPARARPAPWAQIPRQCPGSARARDPLHYYLALATGGSLVALQNCIILSAVLRRGWQIARHADAQRIGPDPAPQPCMLSPTYPACCVTSKASAKSNAICHVPHPKLHELTRQYSTTAQTPTWWYPGHPPDSIPNP